MDFAALKTELAARGFDYLSDTRLGQYVNFAYHEFQEAAPWPWRSSVSAFTTWTGTDRTVTNAARVTNVLVAQSATGPFTRLAARPYGELVDGTPSSSGAPRYFTVSADPTTTTTLTVSATPWVAGWVVINIYYLGTYADLTASNVPAIPAAYHMTLVDIAARKAYQDADNFEAAAALTPEIDKALTRAAASHLEPQFESSEPEAAA